MMRLTPSSGAPLSRSTTSMVISWSGAATVLTWMLSEPRERRHPPSRTGEFHRPVVRAYVERRDSLNLGVLERAGPRPDCAGKSAGGNDGIALVSDSEGSAVELATTGALYADVESKDLASRDRRRDVPGIDMNVVWFDPAAGIGTGSRMGDAVAFGG